MPGLITHRWHGKKLDRKYNERWRVLVNANFDPVVDLKRDTQGLWTLTPRSLALRDGLRMYAAARNEDGGEI